MSESVPTPRDAATVLLLRGETDFEIFMVRRGARAQFMANAMVFPGGRLDDADHAPAIARRCALDPARAAALLGDENGHRALALLVAAVRETFEEAGVLLARRDDQLLTLDDPHDAARFQAHRDALNAKETSLAEILDAEDLTLAVDAVTYYTRWVTPTVEKRRYDARFLMTRAPSGQRPLHDAHETTASEWLSPRAALAAYAAREIQLAPPTLRILRELARVDSATDAMKLGPPLQPIQPQPLFEDGVLHLLLPGDPQFDPPGKHPNRVTLRDGHWDTVGEGA